MIWWAGGRRKGHGPRRDWITAFYRSLTGFRKTNHLKQIILHSSDLRWLKDVWGWFRDPEPQSEVALNSNIYQQRNVYVYFSIITL